MGKAKKAQLVEWEAYFFTLKKLYHKGNIYPNGGKIPLNFGIAFTARLGFVASVGYNEDKYLIISLPNRTGRPMSTALAILFSYAVGCFCSAYYLVRWRTGQDIRALGSGTAGARNAGRVLGKTGFIIAFLGDVLKGSLAVWLAQWLAVGAWGEAAAMVAVVLGHLYPVQLGGRGGKGASTGFGAVLVIHPLLGLLCVLIAAIVFAFTRGFTVSGAIAIATAPLTSLLLGIAPAHWVGLFIVVVLLLYAHRDNLRETWVEYREKHTGARRNA
jgi:acyl phosphate:glycerol-3-phosphate acyltransferase